MKQQEKTLQELRTSAALTLGLGLVGLLLYTQAEPLAFVAATTVVLGVVYGIVNRWVNDAASYE